MLTMTRHCLLLFAALFVLSACDTGVPGDVIPGVTQSAARLQEFDDRGDYSPYFGAGEMNTPRYHHQAILHSNGNIYGFGGSDENGFSSLDTVEIYDQSITPAGEFPPESGTGAWIDTNFEGDPIIMPSGGRVFHTVTEIGGGNMVIIGGAANLGGGAVQGKVDVLDVLTREFVTLDAELQEPRFRHTTIRIPTGELMILGGQTQGSFATDDPNNQGPQGIPNQATVTVFPTTKLVELFSPREQTFAPLTAVNGSPSELQTQRGRAGHGVTRVAGPDNVLGTNDDIFMIFGGVQTLSAASGGAPTTKVPGSDSGAGQRSIEVFDPSTGIITLLASIDLENIRANFPEGANLGEYNDRTPDGIIGLGNAVLVAHGDDDSDNLTTFFDQVFVATYSVGAGPARGVRFFEVVEDDFFSHAQNSEYLTGNQPVVGEQIARTGTNLVSLPRPLEGTGNVDDRQTWVFSLAGVDATGGNLNYNSPAMSAGCVFDAFYSRRASEIFRLDPTDLTNERRTAN
ncbi:MAG: hypothetical protein AAF488_16290, partial [Planctomycetota bacterium]